MKKTGTDCSPAMVLAWCASAFADVRLPNLFSDHMVLQRDKPIKVWGWAAPGEQVKVELSGKAAETSADANAELPDFTAVGYFFAREIHQAIKVPVGMITAAQGATRIEQWTPPERSRENPEPRTGGGALYNGMIAPLVPFPMRGALCLEGSGPAQPDQQRGPAGLAALHR